MGTKQVEFVRLIALEVVQQNIALYSDEQLRHIMDMCEVEIVNRMAQENGHDPHDQVDP